MVLMSESMWWKFCLFAHVRKTYIVNICKRSPWWKITLLKWSFVSIFFISIIKVFMPIQYWWGYYIHHKWEPIHTHADYLLWYPIWSGFALEKKAKIKLWNLFQVRDLGKFQEKTAWNSTDNWRYERRHTLGTW